MVNKKNKKSGWIYFLECVTKTGVKIYTGKTKRTPYERVGEHIKSVKSDKSKTWVGRCKKIKLLGAIYSSNCDKAEMTCKNKTPVEKRRLATLGARSYKLSNISR